MKNKFIKILILMSILFISLTRGNTHFVSISSMSLHLDTTLSHCSQGYINKLQKNHNICDFVCHFIFLHAQKEDANTFISYNHSFYFKSNFNSLKLINIFKPPIYI